MDAEPDIGPDLDSFVDPPPELPVTREPPRMAPRRERPERPERVDRADRADRAAERRDDRPTGVVREMREEDDQSLKEWMDSLTAESAVKVHIIRKKPQLGPRGEQLDGSLEIVEDKVDEDYLRETWGGGTYQLKVFTPRGKNGEWSYFRARSVKIAGEPRMHGRVLTSHAETQASRGDDDSLADKAFAAMQRNAERAQTRAEKLEEQRAAGNGHQGLDINALNALNAPLLEQLRSAAETIRDLQRQVYDGLAKPPPTDPFRDKLLERAISDESTRIKQMRENFESEVRQMREHHRAEIAQIRSQVADDQKAAERRHERELDMLKNSYESNIKSHEVAYGTRTDGLKSEVDRLNRELTEGRARIGALELKKDQSITDKAEEIAKIGDVLDGLRGDKGDDKDKPWYERVIDAVGNSEAAIGFINKIGGAAGIAGAPGTQGALPASNEQASPPIGVPFQTGDGNIYVRNPDGTTSLVDPRSLQRPLKKKKRRKVQAQAAAQPEGAVDDVIDEAMADDEGDEDDELASAGRPPDAAEVAIAVNFMENAIRNNTDPAVFGATARNLIPGDILAYIHQVGVDVFLNKVARLESGSPLTTMKGRQFARSVAKYLLEGTTE